MLSILAASWLASQALPAIAQSPGTFADGGNTQVSAMMMLVGNSDKVYILDKTEGNAAQIDGHPAWGSVWDINTHDVDLMSITTNTFCASGMHLPNGSFVTFGGNSAIGPGGNIGSDPNNFGGADYDATYQDYDGTKAIRILDPCTDTSCAWYDDPSVISMQQRRWYSAAEPLADGTIAIIGGFVNGGYVNRNYPNVDPQFEGGAAECTYEFFPSNGQTATTMNFLIQTSGLNSYAHTYLMKSGLMLVQANVSTMLWDPATNTETALPDMPGGVARVYPASGGVAMLPLTPANNYTPTVLFCGGSDMPEYDYGNYSWPFIDTWNYPASTDCQRLTPEPEDGSTPAYQQDDDMEIGRTMGQFIILPNGKLLMINGGQNGTAGYATQTLTTTSYSDMPNGMSLASGPVLTPAIYDPNAPSGSRWSSENLSASTIPRLYHSSAILLPDGSVLVAGSNPNVDVNLTTTFPTTYQAEIFYPSYFSASTRPIPSGIPSNITYGGNSFDVTLPSSSYTGDANDAADNTTVVLIRQGFTTHGMNMGQRYMQLNNTYTVNSDGSIALHVAQAPPIPQIFQPGPAFIFVVVNGIPSNGTYVLVGNGQVGTQPLSAASTLPASVRLSGVAGNGSSSSSSSSSNQNNGATSNKGALVGGIVGGLVLIALLGTLIGVLVARRRRAANTRAPSTAYANRSSTSGGGARVGGAGARGGPYSAKEEADSTMFIPLAQDNSSRAWNASSPSLSLSPQQRYRDEDVALAGGHSRPMSPGIEEPFDPYSEQARMSTTSGRPHRY